MDFFPEVIVFRHDDLVQARFDDDNKRHITEQVVNTKLLSFLPPQDRGNANVSQLKTRVREIKFFNRDLLHIEAGAFQNFTRLKSVFLDYEYGPYTIETAAFQNIGTELEENEYFEFLGDCEFYDRNEFILNDNSFINVKFKWIYLKRHRHIKYFNIENAIFICIRSNGQLSNDEKQRIKDLNAKLIFKESIRNACQTIIKQGETLVTLQCIYNIIFDVFDYNLLQELGVTNREGDGIQNFESCIFDFDRGLAFHDSRFTHCRFKVNGIALQNVEFIECNFERTRISDADHATWNNCNLMNLQFDGHLHGNMGIFDHCTFNHCTNINQCFIYRDSLFSNTQYIPVFDIRQIDILPYSQIINEIPFIFLVTTTEVLDQSVKALIDSGLQKFDTLQNINDDARDLNRATYIYQLVRKDNFEQYLTQFEIESIENRTLYKSMRIQYHITQLIKKYILFHPQQNDNTQRAIRAFIRSNRRNLRELNYSPSSSDDEDSDSDVRTGAFRQQERMQHNTRHQRFSFVNMRL